MVDPPGDAIKPENTGPADSGGPANTANTGNGRAARRPPKRKRPFWAELAIRTATFLVVAFVLQQFVGRVYAIPSGSMETTLHGCRGCFGDRVVADRILYRFTDPAPGDVVVFKGPESWIGDETSQASGNAVSSFFAEIGSVFGLGAPKGQVFVKRVVATGGQTVRCCDERNRVVVDGKALDEPYIHWTDSRPPKQQPFQPVRVPDGSVWVMGDNRNKSKDSRFQGGGGVRGAVPVDNIIGKARIILLPPGRWGGISDHNPQLNAQPVSVPD